MVRTHVLLGRGFVLLPVLAVVVLLWVFGVEVGVVGVGGMCIDVSWRWCCWSC